MDPWPWIIEQITQNWNAVERTPMPFIAALVVGAAIGWMGIAMLHRERLSFWKDLVTEYKDKLNGASPTDAAERIQALEQHILQLRHVQRRTITDQQGAILRDALADEHLLVLYNSANAEAEEFARLLTGYMPPIIGLMPTNEVPLDLEGIFLRVVSLNRIPARARIISNALRKAGIDHEFTEAPQHAPPLQADYCVMVIGRKSPINL